MRKVEDWLNGGEEPAGEAAEGAVEGLLAS
jgi:hypothetical protein